MPPEDTRKTKVRLRTKKNPDGSQQYIRGENDLDQQMTLHKNLDTTYSTNNSKARELLLKALKEHTKPVTARLKIRRDKDLQNTNRDRSR